MKALFIRLAGRRGIAAVAFIAAALLIAARQHARSSAAHADVR